MRLDDVPAQGPDRDLVRPTPARRPLDVLRATISFLGPSRIIGGLVGAALFAGAVVWLVRPPAPPVEASLPFAAPVTAADASDSEATSNLAPAGARDRAVVHVAGAVQRPGLVEVAGEARVADAIAAAGGPSTDADPGALNLAQRVVDGQRIYVPRHDEQVPPGGWDGAGDGGGGDDPARPIDVNRAGVTELQALPGIGPALAAAVVDHRDRHGPFRHVDDLLEVRGIGPAKLDAIRDLVSV